MSSWGNDALLICGAAAGLLTGCQLGGDGDDDLGPYQNATIEVSAPEGVADGLTGVEVTVTGDVGSRLVLELIGGGQFLNSDPGNASEKTLFLAGEGTATAEVVSTRPIEVAVAFKPDHLLGPQTIEFLPVVFAAGTPSAKLLHPGLVETEFCLAANTAQGFLVTKALIDPEAGPDDTGGGEEEEPPPEDEFAGEDGGDGGFEPEFAPAPGIQATAQLSATAPDGLDCPEVGSELDSIGWVGYTKMFVRTDLEHAMVALDYARQANDTGLYSGQVELFLDPFPGYDITVEDPVDNIDYVEVAMHVDYGELADLGGVPADGVTITQRCIPDCPDLLGTSAGGADDPIITDADGNVTLFFDPAGAGTYVWFVELSGGIEQRMLPDLTF